MNKKNYYSFKDFRKVDEIILKMRLSKLIRLKNRIKTKRNIQLNQKKDLRYLEIGPGLNTLKGFETLNIIDGKDVDYILDISSKLPFDEFSFDLIYASHVLEHIPWYSTSNVLKEFYRSLKKGGIVEIWVPDGLKISKMIVDFEDKNENNIDLDGWYRYNEKRCPYLWANGRIFTYGDGRGTTNHHNWHRALFTFKYLNKLLSEIGFSNITQMHNSEVRGEDHGWINLGIKAKK